MDWKWLILSRKGRVGRKLYLMSLIPLFLIGVVFSAIDIVNGVPADSMGTFQIVGTLITLYPTIALSVKRAHDRGRSGWFYLVLLIPLLNLWVMVELLFLKGTTGENMYGNDPLTASVQN